jgi:hypothetical protein
MSRFMEIYRRCQDAAAKAGGEPFCLWPMTDEALAMWRGNSGNAKARRRWRRRHVPNTQRLLVTASTADAACWPMES